MTGFGRAEVAHEGVQASAEVRSVNSRFLDVSVKLPRSLSQREKDVREIVRGFLNRGSLSVVIKVEREERGDSTLKVNGRAARSYFKLLNDLRKTVKLKEKVRLEHLLTFSEILEPEDEDEGDEKEWNVAEAALRQSLDALNGMRIQEGTELVNDLRRRIDGLNGTIDRIQNGSLSRIPDERKRLQERVTQLVSDPSIIDAKRLELELALLADKLDVTEECVRFRSHNKYFLEALGKEESAGRKLNFLIQEMNREANTIGSKSNDAEISHLVVQMKEELEKIREQLQNIE